MKFRLKLPAPACPRPVKGRGTRQLPALQRRVVFTRSYTKAARVINLKTQAWVIPKVRFFFARDLREHFVLGPRLANALQSVGASVVGFNINRVIPISVFPRVPFDVFLSIYLLTQGFQVDDGFRKRMNG